MLVDLNYDSNAVVYDAVQSSNPTAPHIWGLIWKAVFCI